MENNNGAYDLEGVIFHQHSNRLMEKILELWPDKSVPVVDLGCGHNFYCSVLDYAGYKAVGVDGVKMKGVDAQIDITQIDFRKDTLKGYITSWLLPKNVDINVISLECGEHIPQHLSDAYINNLTSFGGDVIMSWAIPGQPGVGHINCQTNEWVIEQMASRGYNCDWDKSLSLRQSVVECHCSWFKNTLMYFTHGEK